MFLDSVVIKDKLDTRVQKYSFEYNNLAELPVRLSYAKDHWGYFNGANNSSLLPDAIPGNIKQTFFPLVPASRMSANRNANYLYSRKGMLSKITYPTGGYTTYEYEPHISINHSSVEHGGVRLKAQRSYSATGQLSFVNEYSYSGGKGGWDIHDIQYYQGRLVNKHSICYPSTGFPYEVRIQFDIYKLYSNTLYSLFLSEGNNIEYQYVTAVNGDGATNSGKEVDEFEIGNDDFEQLLLYWDNTSGPLMFPRPYTNSGWKTGKKLRETYYKNNSGTYVPVKEVIYTYKEDAANPYKFTHKATYMYDTYANLRQIDHDYNISTTYLWSFGNTLPVAKDENATYSQVSTSLGTSFINTFGTTTSSSSVGTQLTSLRNTLSSGLPNAMVSTFNYTPQVGMISQTDPNGVTTSYEYDPAGRLKNVRDKDQYILSRNYYHYYSDSGTDVASLSLNPATMSFPYTAYGPPFTITSNTSWTATTDRPSWITVSPTSGTGNGTIGIKPTALSTGSPLGYDLIQPVEYDAYGREDKKYLAIRLKWQPYKAHKNKQ